MVIGPLPPLDVLGKVTTKTDNEAVIDGHTADGSAIRLTITGDVHYFLDGEQFRIHFIPLPETK